MTTMINPAEAARIRHIAHKCYGYAISIAYSVELARRAHGAEHQDGKLPVFDQLKGYMTPKQMREAGIYRG